MRLAMAVLRLFAPPLIVAVALAFFVRENCFRLFAIPSDSMAPTLVRGDQIAVVPYSSAFRSVEPQVGDVIVFRRDDAWYVKRVVGAAGDHIEVREGRLRRNGHTVAEPYLVERIGRDEAPEIVPGGALFVMGDNRNDSVDSRSFGAIPRDAVLGRARLIVWSSSSFRVNEPAHAEGEATRPSAPFVPFGRRVLSPVD